MLKIRNFLIFLLGIFFISLTADARVCFLAGGGDEDASCLISPFYDGEKCTGYQLCDVPALGGDRCTDDGVTYYLPEDCCSGSNYERCEAAEGKVCSGATCSGTDADGNTFTTCEIGKCQCDSSYSEECSAADGLVGVGSACDGKYQSCQCSNSFYACDTSASCSGSSCTDSRGQLCSACVCPIADGSDWVSDPDECCWGFSSSCTNRPSGDTVYKCRTGQTYDCVCGYNYTTSKGHCISGCTDSKYKYVGNLPEHVVCSDFTSGITAACGGGTCTCESGYWDYTETCSKQPDNICANLGYTDSTCSGDWIGCPFDASAKKCIGDQEESCANGFASAAKDCGSSGASGWSLAFGSAKCRACLPKPCPSVYTVEACINPLANDVCWSGDTKKCKPVECAEGYATDVEDCGTTGSEGWTFAFSIGDTETGDCKQCMPKPCLSGYTEENCSSVLSKDICWNGDTKKCKIKTSVANCPSNCKYNCSNAGGPECSQTSTWGGQMCMACIYLSD